MSDNPMVALNHALAVAMVYGPSKEPEPVVARALAGTAQAKSLNLQHS
jgi:predicted RNA polymerase sigma factor